ncbi:MAG: LuxR C-terminal-related transcriptional regulator [Anaerolineae bacterium]|jgi:LuxR family maltose regulon positive regulatory protein
MATPLLTTKLYIPPVRPGRVPRPHLLARLDAGLHRKLTLIAAPAGSGKTTLASAWLSRLRRPASDRPAAGEGAPAPRDVAWLSLDAGDSDPARFFTYLLAALARIDATLGQGVRPLLEAPHLPSVERIVTALINDLAARSEPAVLALDDYHAVDDLAIHEALGMLIERQPAGLHLVLITRHDPPLSLSRLRGRGQMTEIRQHDLRFRPDEVTHFLNQSMGLGLTPAEASLLERRTEGWITGLQLAALSMQGRDPDSIASFIDGFSGRTHFLLDYLTDEVLNRQPSRIQRFLLRTSILDRMCAALCDALLADWDLGTPGDWAGEHPASGSTEPPIHRSAAILNHLERANLFLTPLDDEHRWYRYHALFRDLLRARLQETQPEKLPLLHHRAAVWYEEAGLGVEAVRHALASGDDDLAAAVVERTVTRLSTWSRADTAMIHGWLQALPGNAIRDRPWLRLFAARTLYVSGQPEMASRTLAELESWLRDHPDVPDAAHLAGLVTVDRASYAAVLGDVAQARALTHEVLAGAPDDDPIARFRAPAILGMAAYRAGDVVEAEAAFSRAIDITLEAGLTFAAVPFFCNLAEMLIVQGRLREARQACEEALALSTVDGEPVFSAGFVGLELGKLLYEWNELADAERQLADGLDLLRQGGIGESFGSMHAVLAHVKQTRGDTQGALDAIRQAVEHAQRDGIPRLRILALAHQARIWLAQGRHDLAADWARDYRQVGDTEYLREYEDLTLARVLLAGDDAAGALALLDAMLPPARAAGRWGSAIEIQALRAIALHALDEPDAALAALAQALDQAQPESYVRLFVDMGRPMMALLKAAGSRGIAPRYVGQLLAAFSAIDTHGPTLEPQPLVEPLTERELDVLRLLAQRLSNREIGRRLFISVPTVKSHTGNIYGKLGVHSRDDAVARARALGILPPAER